MYSFILYGYIFMRFKLGIQLFVITFCKYFSYLIFIIVLYLMCISTFYVINFNIFYIYLYIIYLYII